MIKTMNAGEMKKNGSNFRMNRWKVQGRLLWVSAIKSPG
jgi:hypothetical protein